MDMNKQPVEKNTILSSYIKKKAWIIKSMLDRRHYEPLPDLIDVPEKQNLEEIFENIGDKAEKTVSE